MLLKVMLTAGVRALPVYVTLAIFASVAPSILACVIVNVLVVVPVKLPLPVIVIVAVPTFLLFE